MKELITTLLACGFVYYMFSSYNKSFDTFNWNGSSLSMFSIIVFVLFIMLMAYKDLKNK